MNGLVLLSHYCSISVSHNLLVKHRETGTAECSSSCENGGSEHANGDASQSVNGGHAGHPGHPGHAGVDVVDADGGQPAAVLPSPDSPEACAEAHTK